jgi:hypothetical protein
MSSGMWKDEHSTVWRSVGRKANKKKPEDSLIWFCGVLRCLWGLLGFWMFMGFWMLDIGCWS